MPKVLKLALVSAALAAALITVTERSRDPASSKGDRQVPSQGNRPGGAGALVPALLPLAA